VLFLKPSRKIGQLIFIQFCKFKLFNYEKKKLHRKQDSFDYQADEGGRAIDDLCRENGISKATVYNWRKRYTGMDGGQVRQLKELQDENKRLKHMYAELSLDYKLAKEIIEKKL
jgi:putative transposase